MNSWCDTSPSQHNFHDGNVCLVDVLTLSLANIFTPRFLSEESQQLLVDPTLFSVGSVPDFKLRLPLDASKMRLASIPSCCFILFYFIFNLLCVQQKRQIANRTNMLSSKGFHQTFQGQRFHLRVIYTNMMRLISGAGGISLR